MLKLQNIHKTFQSGSEKLQVLNGVNLALQKGEFLSIIGANGSGKSTLLNILAGNLKPDLGEVLVNEENITKLQDFQRSSWLARVFQDPMVGTAPELTILENLRIAATRGSAKRLTINTGHKFKAIAQERVAELGLGLENKLNQEVGLLSGGQRQALTLVMATLAPAQILLMDEPTAALDPKTAAMIMQIADKFHRNFSFTTLMVTHNLKDSLHYGNRLIMMKSGKIVKDIAAEAKLNLNLPEVINWFDE